MEDLLRPSTTQSDLDQLWIVRDLQSRHCPFLRLTNINLDMDEWLVDRYSVHNGAHFPLIVWTDNAKARIHEAQYRRNTKRDSGNSMRIPTGDLSYGMVVGFLGEPANLEPMCPISAVHGVV